MGLGDLAGELEIRIGDGALRVCIRDKRCLYVYGEASAPQDGLEVGVGEKPDASHTKGTGVGGADRH